MPKKPKRPCSYPGCPELTNGRYCERHEKEMTREYNRNNRAYKYLYNTARWKKLRIKFLKENPLCAECGKIGIVRPAEVVDHIIPHKGNKELFWDEDNLQALCKECHDRKTAKEDGRWGEKDKLYKY